MTVPASPCLARRNLIAASGAALLLAGCSGLLGPSTPPLQLYLLRPTLQPPADSPSVSWGLAVARPEASQSLDTERIALERGETMDYFADAQWTDSTPRLLQTLLVEAFEQSGKIVAVARESGSVHADYRLESELRDFAAHYDSENGAPEIVVTLVARLVAAKGRVAATLNSSQRARATQNSVPAVVQAFDQALAATLEQVVAWTLQAPEPKQPA